MQIYKSIETDQNKWDTMDLDIQTKSGNPSRSIPTPNALADAQNNQNGSKKLTAHFRRTKKFDKKVLNHILMI
ncbi:hypothetical protein PSHT_01139 [Puccinia striiformis]|uniref:Uncharacterized protein n=1 Tax=Puccinia striiformis TaxID=27350 RepID=A0A2S4WKZ9_9BASI|nr:hypothetical protein PSHT_01139 [Puccinia striiformis]